MKQQLTSEEIEEDRKGKKRFRFYMILCCICFFVGVYAGTVYYKYAHSEQLLKEGYNKAINDLKAKINENERVKNIQPI